MADQDLIDELTDDPLSRGYASMTAEQVLASLHAEDVPCRVLVPLWAVKKAAIEKGCWSTIKLAAETSDVAAVKAVAVTAVNYVEDLRFENLDMDLESTETLLGNLVTLGLMTSQESAFLDALANSVTSRMKQLDKAWRLRDIIAARTEMEG